MRGTIKVPRRPTAFGQELQIKTSADLLLVSVDRGHGLEPRLLLLPHQLYEDTVGRLLEQTPGCQRIVVTPCNAAHLEVWSER